MPPGLEAVERIVALTDADAWVESLFGCAVSVAGMDKASRNSCLKCVIS